MSLPGSTQLGHAKRMLSTLPWNQFAPAVSVFDGAISSSITSDHRCGLAYSLGDSLLLKRDQIKAPFRAQWFDPTSGQFRDADFKPLSDEDQLQFTSPGPNAAGDRDWVLVVRSGE
jgi:hypothetical protein